MKEINYHAHKTACIDEGAIIGEGTRIWHFCHVMKGAQIGNNCVLGQNVFVGAKATIHDNVKIQNNVSVYDAVIIEDGVFCGPSMVFTNVFNPRSEIERKDEYRTTVIRKGASIGANATILCGVSIGSYAFIGAGSVVTKNVSPHALVYGNPALQRGWICQCGVKLTAENNPKDELKCAACGKKYRYDNQQMKEL